MSLFSFLDKTATPQFGEGQIWSYRARAGEEDSTVLINKVEIGPWGKRIFHISIFGLRVKNPSVAGGVSKAFSHFPVSADTLKLSLTRMVRKSPPNPAYEAGYATWKAAFLKGDAGVFSIGVAEIVDSIEASLNAK